MWKVTLTEVSEVDSSGNMYVVFDVTNNDTSQMLYKGQKVEGLADNILQIGREKITELKRLAVERAKLKVGDSFLI